MPSGFHGGCRAAAWRRGLLVVQARRRRCGREIGARHWLGVRLNSCACARIVVRSSVACRRTADLATCGAQQRDRGALRCHGGAAAQPLSERAPVPYVGRHRLLGRSGVFPQRALQQPGPSVFVPTSCWFVDGVQHPGGSSVRSFRAEHGGRTFAAYACVARETLAKAARKSMTTP